MAVSGDRSQGTGRGLRAAAGLAVLVALAVVCLLRMAVTTDFTHFLAD